MTKTYDFPYPNLRYSCHKHTFWWAFDFIDSDEKVASSVKKKKHIQFKTRVQKPMPYSRTKWPNRLPYYDQNCQKIHNLYNFFWGCTYLHSPHKGVPPFPPTRELIINYMFYLHADPAQLFLCKLIDNFRRNSLRLVRSQRPPTLHSVTKLIYYLGGVSSQYNASSHLFG